jgi:Icc-related predicted phosphoesterase
MRIQYCSDLHLEKEENSRYLAAHPLEVSGEVLILAGDIVPLHDSYFGNGFFRFVSDRYRQVFWVPGNHEFYYTDLADYAGSFQIAVHHNIRILNNTELEFEGIRFVFCTLWSRIGREKERLVEKNLPDFASIQNRKRKFRAADFNRLHHEGLEFLQRAFEKSDARTVVVTHHMPSRLCNPQVRNLSPVNEAFCADLNGLVETSGARFWIYGHSHHNTRPLIVGNTLLITNQLGYLHLGEHGSFRRNAYFSV